MAPPGEHTTQCPRPGGQFSGGHGPTVDARPGGSGHLAGHEEKRGPDPQPNPAAPEPRRPHLPRRAAVFPRRGGYRQCLWPCRADTRLSARGPAAGAPRDRPACTYSI